LEHHSFTTVAPQNFFAKTRHSPLSAIALATADGVGGQIDNSIRAKESLLLASIPAICKYFIGKMGENFGGPGFVNPPSPEAMAGRG